MARSSLGRSVALCCPTGHLRPEPGDHSSLRAATGAEPDGGCATRLDDHELTVASVISRRPGGACAGSARLLRAGPGYAAGRAGADLRLGVAVPGSRGGPGAVMGGRPVDMAEDRGLAEDRALFPAPLFPSGPDLPLSSGNIVRILSRVSRPSLLERPTRGRPGPGRSDLNPRLDGEPTGGVGVCRVGAVPSSVPGAHSAVLLVTCVGSRLILRRFGPLERPKLTNDRSLG